MSTAPMPEKKKGLHPLAWVAIGCGALVVLGGIVAFVAGIFVFNKAREFAKEVDENPVAATARLIAAADPDIEIVDDDSDAKTMTFRNVKTGETITVSYDDIQKGKVAFSSQGKTATVEVAGTDGQGAVTVKTDEGTATFGSGTGTAELPDWLPAYPGVTPQGTFTSTTGDVRGGAFSFRTSSSPEQVAAFYTREFEKLALKINSQTTTPGGIVLAAATTDGSRAANVVAARDASDTQVTLQFTEKTRR